MTLPRTTHPMRGGGGSSNLVLPLQGWGSLLSGRRVAGTHSRLLLETISYPWRASCQDGHDLLQRMLCKGAPCTVVGAFTYKTWGSMTASVQVSRRVPLTLPCPHSREGPGSLPLSVLNTNREDTLVSGLLEK